VATRHGLRGPSFRLAAVEYSDAVGGAISESSLRRLTLGSGEKVAAWKAEEAEQASAPAQRGEDPRARRVAARDPLREQANVSTDGTMIRIREEGWKEVKVGAISRAEVQPPSGKEADSSQRERASATRSRSSRRDEDPRVHLSDHSYCAGVWDADELGRHLYAEGLRRCLDEAKRLSSVNDAARWIERIMLTNFPQAVQIVDWQHASGRLWMVGQALYGEGSEQTKKWVGTHLDDLWQGKGWAVVRDLRALDLDQRQVPDEVRQAPGYFESNLARMRYDQFRAEGYPIGSGTVESGCNNVVQHRMRRPGRGWTRDNANSMLASLCELNSGRFTCAWQQIHHPQPQSHPYF
jgi:hypothetical protein